MLGIRHIGEIQADLFLGEYRDFFCDRWVLVTPQILVACQDKLSIELEKTSIPTIKHVGLVIPVGSLPAKANDDQGAIHTIMEVLKTHLERSSTLRRLTVILGDSDEYHRFREVFWQVFPESPLGTTTE